MLTNSYQAGAALDATTANASPEAFSLILLKSRGQGPFFLQKRERSNEIEYAGRICLFGGRIENSETPEGCAVRELAEETGLDLSVDQLEMLARVESQNEAGARNFGHIYVVEDLDLKALKKLAVKGGEPVFLTSREIDRRHNALTPITRFALGAYEDLTQKRSLMGVSKKRSGILGFAGI
ncbi:MAG: NUDIX hydrolase [Pseudomonadota bacterium]